MNIYPKYTYIHKWIGICNKKGRGRKYYCFMLCSQTWNTVGSGETEFTEVFFEKKIQKDLQFWYNVLLFSPVCKKLFEIWEFKFSYFPLLLVKTKIYKMRWSSASWKYNIFDLSLIYKVINMKNPWI